MVVTKYLALISLLFFLVGTSFGVNWNIIGSNSTLIFGYVNYSNPVSLNVNIIDGSGNVYFDGSPEFSSDYDTNEVMSGAFYKELKLDSGNYIAILNVDGESFTKEFKVNSFSTFVYPKIVGIFQNEEKTTVYVNVTNKGKSNFDGYLTLYFRNGIEKYGISVDANTSRLFEFKIDTDRFGKNTLLVAYVDGNFDYKLFKSSVINLSKDFEVEIGSISLQRGTSKDFSFKIKNLDNYTLNLDINYDSNLEVYGDNQVSVPPKSEVEVPFSVSVPRDFNDTPYLKITVGGKEKEVNVEVLPAQGFEVNVNKVVGHPGKLIETYAIVKNVGDLKEDVQFSYEVFGKDYVYPFKITLDPNEKYEFPVYIQIPSNQTTDFELNIYVNGNKYQSYVEVEPYVKTFEASLNQTEFYLMAGNSAKAKIKIMNTGNVRDVYKIKVIGWDYYLIEKNKIDLNPGQSKTIEIEIKSFNDTKIGNYNFNVEVCDEVCKNVSAYLTIDKPEAEKSKVTFYGKDEVKFTNNKTINYTIYLKNEDIKEKEYLIEFGNFTHKEISLMPNESKNISFSISPQRAENYKFNVSVYAQGTKIWSKELKLDYVGNKITGAFILVPREVSMIGLILLAIVGGIGLGLYIGEKVKIKMNREKAVVSNDFR